VLFHDLRFDENGNENADFPLNQAAYRGAKIIVAGRNFGGGSSREAAVYALYDYGIRCVIAPSFGDIHYQNAIKNGLLPAIVSEADAAELAAKVTSKPDLPVTVDLGRLTVSCVGRQYSFTIDPVSRNQLLNARDDIDLTDSHRSEIAAFKLRDRERRPWATPVPPRPV
jgi:3-isopropylmalate/(R)-2-methylmalate dehydratase small subunit